MALNFTFSIDSDTGILDYGKTFIITDDTDNYGSPEKARSELSVHVVPRLLSPDSAKSVSVESYDPETATQFTFKPEDNGVFTIQCYAVFEIPSASLLSGGATDVGRPIYITGNGLYKVKSYNQSSDEYELVSINDSDLVDIPDFYFAATYSFYYLIEYQFAIEYQKQGVRFVTNSVKYYEKARDLYKDMGATLSVMRNAFQSSKIDNSLYAVEKYRTLVTRATKFGY